MTPGGATPPGLKSDVMDPTETPGREDPSVIYVGNLPYDVTEDEIVIFFKEYNALYVRKMQRELKCFAFVHMSSAEDAAQAVTSLNRTPLRGRLLVLRSMSQYHNEKKRGPSQLLPTATPGSPGEPRMTDRRDEQIFISNLPNDVCKEELRNLFKDFRPENLRIYAQKNYSFAFVTLPSAEDVLRAVSRMHGLQYRGQRMSCKVHCEARHPRRDPAVKKDSGDMKVSAVPSKPHDPETPVICSGVAETKIYEDKLPKDVPEDDIFRYRPISAPREPALEIRHLNSAPLQGCGLNVASADSNPGAAERATSPPAAPVPACEPSREDSDTAGQEQDAPAKNLLLIPVEMRGSFLAAMLKGCFNDLSWLGAIMNMRGEWSLLVTNAYPGAQYFWAVPLTEETYNTLSDICDSLVQAEPGLPRVTKGDVQRGTRCLARCVLTTEEEEGTWSRCWVSDVAAGFAVVFFLDFGVTDVVPISALRSLDDHRFWEAPPMAQPFLLLEGPDIAGSLGTVLKGHACGTCSRERHILKFSPLHKED